MNLFTKPTHIVSPSHISPSSKGRTILLLLLALGLLPGCATDPETPAPTASSAAVTTATNEPVPSDPQPASATEINATATISIDPTSETSSSLSPTEEIPEPTRPPMIQEYPVPSGSRPHDVAPAPDGSVWYTAQRAEALGRLDPETGETHHIPLGNGSAPHGVIVGPDGAPWITDGGLNAIVRVDPVTEEVMLFPLPAGSGYTNLNTAVFDARGVLWFTGQSGVYGRLDPAVGQVELFQAPRGRGPYGIAVTPGGEVYYASLAGNHIAQIDSESRTATVLEPPTPDQGSRRIWADSQGFLWVSQWTAGQVARYDPMTDSWREWRLPGNNPMPYAIFVDDQDQIWLSDFGNNALLLFDPVRETFTTFVLPSPSANVRQILGRPGELWGAESGTDKLVVIRTE